METLELEDGKYTVLHDEQHGGLTILRHGEVWRNESGDKFILAMFHEIQRQKAINEYDKFMNDEERRWEDDLYKLLKKCVPHIQNEIGLLRDVEDVISSMEV